MRHLTKFQMLAAAGHSDRYHHVAARMADHVAKLHAGTPRPAGALDALLDELDALDDAAERFQQSQVRAHAAAPAPPPPPQKAWNDYTFAELHALKQEQPERFASLLRAHHIAEGIVATPAPAMRVVRDASGRAYEDLSYPERAELRASNPELAKSLRANWTERGEPEGNSQR